MTPAVRTMLLSAITALLLAATAATQGAATTDTLVAPRRWALVVGASDYEHLGRLRYATRDARAFADSLIDDLGFDEDTVRLLTDDGDDPRLTPTAGHLIGELEALIADPRRNQSDLFVFYFCGHGAGRESGDYLVPTDARIESIERVGLPVREITDRLARAGMRNVLVVADACREGSEHGFGRELWELADAARLTVVLGCEPGAQSYEDRFLGQGVFTHHLTAALGDASLHDAASGAIWASRIATHVADEVREATTDKDEPQQPVFWTDPTRDVLLAVVVPDDAVGADIDSFARDTRRLSPEGQLAALGRYGWSLFEHDQFEQTIEVLKTAEQLGPLPPDMAQTLAASLLMLGRSVEAGRVFAALRERAPNSLPALAATVCDSSGAVSDIDRARAATALWDSGAPVPLGLLLRMVEAHLRGGSSAHALEFAQVALPQAPDGSRDELFLEAVIAMLERRNDEALEMLKRAEGAPGVFPSDRVLSEQRVALLASTRGPGAGIEALDACIARWPDDGKWYAQRAWLRRTTARDASGLADGIPDVRAALDRDLGPEDLLLAVRAAGTRALGLADAVSRRAADHPLSWQAQLASAFARQPTDLREAVAAAARLSARPALTYATMARLTLDAATEQLELLRLERKPEDPVLQGADRQFTEVVRSLYERIAPMAPEFGADASAWTVLAELAQRVLAHEAFHRSFEKHLGAEVDAGSLPESLVWVHGESCLNTGRLERFREGARSLLRDGLERDARTWIEATYLAAAGDTAGARAVLGDREHPIARRNAELGAPLRALLYARAGETERARALIADSSPSSILGRCVTGLALDALGDRERAQAMLTQLESLNPENAFYAYLALWRTAPGSDARRLAQLASLYQPGNPLLHGASFVPDAGIAAFAGGLELQVEVASGPVDATGATFTLSVLGSGRAVGALELTDGSALVVRGRVDAFGNFEGQLVGAADTYPLLAKLAPQSLHDDFDLLRASGQILQVWGTGNVQFAWVCRPVR